MDAADEAPAKLGPDDPRIEASIKRLLDLNPSPKPDLDGIYGGACPSTVGFAADERRLGRHGLRANAPFDDETTMSERIERDQE